MKIDNAIIMAAGTSSRFAPISYEKHKAFIEVNGEILIERQIRQLKEAGINDIIIVTGYLAEDFSYLKEKFQVKLIHNSEYLTRNNNGSIYAVRDYLKNSYICSADNYFLQNPFESETDDSYYSAVYSKGYTKEWCIYENTEGYITNVNIGGSNAWYMLGHTFWSEEFSNQFINILDKIYDLPETKNYLWENIFIQNLDTLKMKIRKYPDNIIFEFDTLDELRLFDHSYIYDSRSKILKGIADYLNTSEKDLINITAYKDNNNMAIGFQFDANGQTYTYSYKDKNIRRIL